MIDVKATGLCTGCTVADLKTEWFEGLAGKTWIIKCTHEEACERASDKAGIEQEDGALLGVKIMCELRSCCLGCRYYIYRKQECGIGHPSSWEYFGGKEGGENV